MTEDNHGAVVSAAAHDVPPGPDHGKAVSAVARDNHGQSASHDDDATENETQAPDNEARETEGAEHDGAEHRGTNSGPSTTSGSGHGGHDGDD
jgi:hypothetical protein